MAREMEFSAVATYPGRDEAGLGQWVGRHESLDGFAAARRNADARHRRRVIEASRLYADALTGRIDPMLVKQAMNPSDEIFVRYLAEKYPGLYGGDAAIGLRETMSVTDYQSLFVDVLDRMYYGFYNAYPIVNKPLVKTHSLRDFRVVKRYLLDGAVTPLTAMDAAAPPPQRAMLGPSPQDGSPATTTAALTYQPLLYQAMTSVNWRAFVNDDLGIFRDLANRLAIAGNRGISKFITGLYMDSNGPNALLYQSGYRNLITTTYGASANNPPLSIQGLQDAFKVLAGMRDSGGDPILMTGKPIIWYGPQYAATAMNLRNMMTANVAVEGGTQNTANTFPQQWLQISNWVVQNAEWILDPYIPIVCSAKPLSWGVTLDPGAQNRPSIEVGWLNGYETPQIYQKIPNTMRLGGGVDATLGDFYTMDQDMKIITVMGGTQIDGRSTVASNGSGQ